jgi:hypothetical protein
MATETKKKTASTAVKAPRAKAVKKPKEVEAAAEAAPAAPIVNFWLPYTKKAQSWLSPHDLTYL